MTLHNYIRRKSQEDVAFTEYDRNPHFIPDDFLADVVSRSQSQGNHRPSQMNYVRDGIADSLMGWMEDNNNVTFVFFMYSKNFLTNFTHNFTKFTHVLLGNFTDRSTYKSNLTKHISSIF